MLKFVNLIAFLQKLISKEHVVVIIVVVKILRLGSS